MSEIKMINQDEYTILTFCNGRKLCVKNNTPQARQILSCYPKKNEIHILYTLGDYFLMDTDDRNNYNNEELTEKLFEGIDKYGLLEFMYMIFDASMRLEGARMGANFGAIEYTSDTLFEVKE